jgi:hypothetical protein
MKNKLLISSTIFLIVSVISGCATNLHSDVADMELLISPSDFPEDYRIVDISTKPVHREGQVSEAYIIMTSTRVNVIARGGETVYRFRSYSQAIQTYKRFQIYLQKTAYSIPIPTPEDFSFESKFTKLWAFGCSIDSFKPSTDTADSTEICVFIAQYDEFFIFFSIAVKVDGVETITINDVNKLLKAIDKEMVGKLLENQ